MNRFYIGTKLVEAWPEDKQSPGGDEPVPGYAVRYSDGSVYWSPKHAFEAAYLALPEGSDGKSITQETVLSLVSHWSDTKLCNKTTAVTATLRNGFELTETCACVEASNYDQRVGVEICRTKILDRIWMLLGFSLQTARNGLTAGETG